MASTGHTYGPSCSLQTDSNVFMRRASVASNDPPKVRFHFFYNSALPIDDPLSPVPLPSNSSTGPSKFPPRPFSVFDNFALEEAWQSLQALERPGKRPETTRSSHNEVSTVDLTKIIRNAAQNKPTGKQSKSNLSVAGQDKKSESRKSLAGIPTTVPAEQNQSQPQQIGDPHLMLCDDPSHVPFDETMPVSSDEISNDEFESGIRKKRHRSPFRRKDKAEKVKGKKDASPRRRLSMHKQKPTEEPYGSSPLERDTTGTPFLRVSDRPNDPYLNDDAGSASEVESNRGSRPASIGDKSSEHSSFPGSEYEAHSKSRRSSRLKQKEHHQASVAVGVSRLHLVKMPELKVRGIAIMP